MVIATPSGRAAGVTIVTHGGQYEAVDHGRHWINGLTDAIAARAGGDAVIYEVNVGADFSENLYLPKLQITAFEKRNTGTEPHLGTTAEVIVRLYWDEVANPSSGGSFGVGTSRVASAFLPFLLGVVADRGLAHPLAELPVHLVGHSRGVSLMAELARLLGAKGVWVEQLTFLDSQPLPGDAAVNIANTVAYADNYFQTLSFPRGVRIAGAFNRQLKTLAGGYFTDHSDVHLWYHGTVAGATPATDGDAQIDAAVRADWWTTPEEMGARAGWYYSRLAGGTLARSDRSAPEQDATAPAVGWHRSDNRTAVARSGTQWPSLLALTVREGDTVFTDEAVTFEFEYQYLGRKCEVSLLLDTDQNPYNANDAAQIPIPTGPHHPGTGTRTVRRAVPWNSAGMATGTYHPYARISVGGIARYLYSPQTLTIVAPSGSGSDYPPALLRDIRPGSLNGEPRYLCASGGVLFFSAIDDLHGRELWKTDGSSDGTVLVRDFLPGRPGSEPEQMTDVNGRVFYVADGGGSISNFNIAGRELFKSNGTASGTGMVKNVNGNTVSSFITGLCNVNGTLFFAADTASLGTELWKSDGTTAGTVLVRDIVNGSGDSHPQSLVNVSGALFFTASTPAESRQLWRSDGSASGTQRVAVTAATSSFLNGFTAPTWLTPFGGRLFFAAHNSYYFRELWITDGTPTGTGYVSDISPGAGAGVDWVTAVGDRLFFSAEGRSGGRELWQTDGSFLGERLVRDINPGGSSAPSELCDVNGTLFFAANDGATNVELWRSNGTEAGTVLVRNINSAGPGGPRWLTAFGGRLYFTAEESTHGRELWVSDGTFLGTYLVADLNPGSESSDPTALTVAGDSLYFTAIAPATGRELWRVGPLRAPRTNASPVVTVTGPKNKSRVTGSTVVLTGTARDDAGVERVEIVWSNGGAARSAPISAVGTGSWTAEVPLAPGLNLLQITALDGRGLRSKQAPVIIYRDQTAPLPVSVEGAGAIGSTLPRDGIGICGRPYTFAAKPAAGQVFLGWTGAVTSSAARITLPLQPGLSLAARFAPSPFAAQAGNYAGGLQGVGDAPQGEGSISCKLEKTRAISGRVIWGGKVIAFKGAVDGEGAARLTLLRKGAEPLALRLFVHGSGASAAILGEVRDGGLVSVFTATRLVR